MENEERSIASSATSTRIITGSYHRLDELKVLDHWFLSNEKYAQLLADQT
jgi:hypothetical protein